MFKFGRPPSHAVSSLTLISGTTLECRVIPTIRAGERRLLLRQGRSYLYDPGTCKCLRKFSGIGRMGNYFIRQIVLFPSLPLFSIIFFLSPFSTRIRVWKVFFLDFLRSYDDRKSVRGKVGVIRRGNIRRVEAAVLFLRANPFEQLERRIFIFLTVAVTLPKVASLGREQIYFAR